MFELKDLSTLLLVIAALVAVTNIITEVVKQLTHKEVNSSLIAIITSLVTTMVSFVAYCQIQSITITWYLIVGSLVVGFMVAYAAMFGFDKLKQILEDIGFKK